MLSLYSRSINNPAKFVRKSLQSMIRLFTVSCVREVVIQMRRKYSSVYFILDKMLKSKESLESTILQQFHILPSHPWTSKETQLLRNSSKTKRNGSCQAMSWLMLLNRLNSWTTIWEQTFKSNSLSRKLLLRTLLELLFLVLYFY